MVVGGGHAWLQGVCMVVGRGMHGWEDVHGCGGHTWLWGAYMVVGGVHGCGGHGGWGACVVVGGMHGCGGHVWLLGGMCRIR